MPEALDSDRIPAGQEQSRCTRTEARFKPSQTLACHLVPLALAAANLAELQPPARARMLRSIRDGRNLVLSAPPGNETTLLIPVAKGLAAIWSQEPDRTALLMQAACRPIRSRMTNWNRRILRLEGIGGVAEPRDEALRLVSMPWKRRMPEASSLQLPKLGRGTLQDLTGALAALCRSLRLVSLLAGRYLQPWCGECQGAAEAAVASTGGIWVQALLWKQRSSQWHPMEMTHPASQPKVR